MIAADGCGGEFASPVDAGEGIATVIDNVAQHEAGVKLFANRGECNPVRMDVGNEEDSHGVGEFEGESQRRSSVEERSSETLEVRRRCNLLWIRGFRLMSLLIRRWVGRGRTLTGTDRKGLIMERYSPPVKGFPHEDLLSQGMTLRQKLMEADKLTRELVETTWSGIFFRRCMI